MKRCRWCGREIEIEIRRWADDSPAPCWVHVDDRMTVCSSPGPGRGQYVTPAAERPM